MNEMIKKLESNIRIAWKQVKLAADDENVAATQTALNKVSHLENLKLQQLTLEKNIAASITDEIDVPGKKAETVFPLEIYARPGKRQTIRPSEIRFGSFKKSIHFANEIPITVANWLIEQGKTLPTFHNFVHPSNTGFARSAKTKRLVSGQYIEIGDHQDILIQKSRKLFDACGYRTLKFEVLFQDGNVVSA
jgi:hypothetical protein